MCFVSCETSLYCGHLSMAYMVPLVPYYIYNVIRLKMSEDSYGLVVSRLFCQYGETNDVFFVVAYLRQVGLLWHSPFAIVVT